MNDESTLEEINRRLGLLIKIAAYQAVGEMPLSEGAPLLRRLGFTASEIAVIYNTTVNTDSVRLAEAKKKKNNKTKGK